MHSIEVVLAMLLAVVASGYLVRVVPVSLPLPVVQIALGAVIAGVFGHGVRLDPEIFFCSSCRRCSFSTAGASPRSGCSATRRPSWSWPSDWWCSPWSAPASSSTG